MISKRTARLFAIKILREHGNNLRNKRAYRILPAKALISTTVDDGEMDTNIDCSNGGYIDVVVRTGNFGESTYNELDFPDYAEQAWKFRFSAFDNVIYGVSPFDWTSSVREKWLSSLRGFKGKELKEARSLLEDTGMWVHNEDIDDLNKEFEDWAFVHATEIRAFLAGVHNENEN